MDFDITYGLIVSIYICCMTGPALMQPVIEASDGCSIPNSYSTKLDCVLSSGVRFEAGPDQHVPPGTVCVYKKCNHTIRGVCLHNGEWQGELSVQQDNTYCNNSRPVVIEDPVTTDILSRKKRFIFKAIYCWIFKCGRRKPKDRTAPVFASCPTDIHKIADPGQFYASVDWDEPVAYDDIDGPVRVTRSGLAPGYKFTGISSITYYTKDRSGNSETCSFDIHVTVVKCTELQPVKDGYKICSPSTYFIHGTRCRFGCYAGHTLHGPSSVMYCQGDGYWDMKQQPHCEKTRCTKVSETADQLAVRTRQCSDGENYRSICVFSCVTGYGILPGMPRVQVCTAAGTWNGMDPKCVDTEPPRFKSCPPALIFYADRSSTTHLANWPVPEAEDNSNTVTVYQRSGPKPDTVISVGTYRAVYEAFDKVNNTAVCSIQIVVKQIRCHPIFPLPYSSVLCKDGTKFGSRCDFTCYNGTIMHGQATTTCEKKNEKYPYGYWSFSNHQPFCKLLELCPVLDPPSKGAVACDVWKTGPLCIPMCQEGFYFAARDRSYHSLLSCKDSGEWMLESLPLLNIKDLPDCIQIDQSTVDRYGLQAAAHFYYSGSCESASVQIKQNFEAALLSTEFYKAHCKEASKCMIKSIQVRCKDSTRIDQAMKNLSVLVEFQLNLINGTGSAKVELWNLRYHAAKAIDEAVMENEIKPAGNNSLINQEVYISPVSLTCQYGSEANMDILHCIPCSPGLYYDSFTKLCTKCPKGFYQHDFGQTTCSNCPETMTTLTDGAQGSDECLAACTPGYFSTTGAFPCSPCPSGFYTSVYATIQCQKCPGTQITDLEAAASVSQCHEFDITFPVGSVSIVTVQSQKVTTEDRVYASFWIQCTNCNNTNLVELSSVTQEILTIAHTEHLTLHIANYSFETSASLLGGRWQNVQVSIEKTNVSLNVDTVEYKWTMPAETWKGHKILTDMNISVGGFAGSLSQLHIWSYRSPSMDMSSLTCFISSQGDIVSWRLFSESYMEAAFITQSTCDHSNDCASNPCRYGSCIDGIGQYKCSCQSGYTGADCDQNIDDCHGNACDNGGTCLDALNSYTCLCKYGFTGSMCQIRVVDGDFGAWSNWSECSMTCGEGTRERYRACDNPPPDNGGLECQGNNLDKETCSTQDCVYECDNLPVIINGDANCTKNQMTLTCYPFCDENHDFDRTLPMEVTCGPNTNNEWNFVNDENPEGDLPMCTEINDPETNTITFRGSYPELTCGENGQFPTANDVRETVMSRIHNLECITRRECNHTGTDIEGCAETPLTKRSIGNVAVAITLSCDSKTVGTEECLQTLVDSFKALEDFVKELGFTITTEGRDFNIDINTISTTGGASCGHGEIPVQYYCVPCGLGTIQDQDECVTCQRGYYQDDLSQLECKQCPGGLTTKGRGARTASYCDVSVPVAGDGPYWIIWVMVASVFVIAMIAALYVIGGPYRTRNSKVAVSEEDNTKQLPYTFDISSNPKFRNSVTYCMDSWQETACKTHQMDCN